MNWHLNTGKNKKRSLNKYKVAVINTCNECGQSVSKEHMVENSDAFYWYNALYKSKYRIGGPNAHAKLNCKCRGNRKIEFINK